MITAQQKLELREWAKSDKTAAIKQYRRLVKSSSLDQAKEEIEDLLRMTDDQAEKLVVSPSVFDIFDGDDQLRRDAIKRAARLSETQAKVALLAILKGMGVEEALEFGSYL